MSTKKTKEFYIVIPQLHSGARGPGAAYSFLALQHGDFIWHDWAHGRGAFHK